MPGGPFGHLYIWVLKGIKRQHLLQLLLPRKLVLNKKMIFRCLCVSFNVFRICLVPTTFKRDRDFSPMTNETKRGHCYDMTIVFFRTCLATKYTQF
jgi:hypothetical protein